jgi:hypothetical protein
MKTSKLYELIWRFSTWETRPSKRLKWPWPWAINDLDCQGQTIEVWLSCHKFVHKFVIYVHLFIYILTKSLKLVAW